MGNVVRPIVGAPVRGSMMIAVILVALLVTQPASAGTATPRPVPVDRDHRGDNNADNYTDTSLKPPGARRDPGWGSFGNGKGGGVIVRDHRH